MVISDRGVLRSFVETRMSALGPSLPRRPRASVSVIRCLAAALVPWRAAVDDPEQTWMTWLLTAKYLCCVLAGTCGRLASGRWSPVRSREGSVRSAWIYNRLLA